MAQHDRLKIDAGIQVYFCDPQSPWQRGTNENTNGLLRQYFPKRHRPEHPQRRRDSRCGCGPQCPTEKDAGLENAGRSA